MPIGASARLIGPALCQTRHLAHPPPCTHPSCQRCGGRDDRLAVVHPRDAVVTRRWPLPTVSGDGASRRGFRWGLLRWRVFAERPSDEAVAGASFDRPHAPETLVQPCRGGSPGPVPKIFRRSQQAPTEPDQRPSSAILRGPGREPGLGASLASLWRSLAHDAVLLISGVGDTARASPANASLVDRPLVKRCRPPRSRRTFPSHR